MHAHCSQPLELDKFTDNCYRLFKCLPSFFSTCTLLLYSKHGTSINFTMIQKIILLVLLKLLVVSCCETNKEEMEVESDKKLSMMCSLKSNTFNTVGESYHINSSMISVWYINNSSEHHSLVQLPARSVNSSLALYEKPRASEMDNGFYYCIINIQALGKRALICRTHLKVGYRPQPVTDFLCVHYPSVKIECWWTQPANPIATHYEM